MASLGHVAVGMLAGRSLKKTSVRQALIPMLICAGLALLPDIDVFWVALGVPDHGPCGHRGAMHSLVPALLVTLVAAALAPRWGLPRWRTALICGLAVGSHALLDAMTTTSRGVPLFWPISFHRFEIPWRPIPCAPCGLAYASSLGLKVARIELVQFFPFLLLALRPAGKPARPSSPGPSEASKHADNYAGRASRSSAPVTRQAT